MATECCPPALLLPHEALCSEGQKPGWRMDQPPAPAPVQFPSQGRGEQVCPAPCPPTVSMEVDDFAQLPSPEMGWGHP